MSHTFRSKDHTSEKGDEISYTFVHDQGLMSGGFVRILAFNESNLVKGPAGKAPEKLGELKVHKDALITFMASLVRGAKISQLEDANDLQVLGL